MIHCWRGPYRGCIVSEQARELPPRPEPTFAELFELQAFREAGWSEEGADLLLFLRRRARWKQLRRRQVTDAGSRPGVVLWRALRACGWPCRGPWEA